MMKGSLEVSSNSGFSPYLTDNTAKANNCLNISFRDYSDYNCEVCAQGFDLTSEGKCIAEDVTGTDFETLTNSKNCLAGSANVCTDCEAGHILYSHLASRDFSTTMQEALIRSTLVDPEADLTTDNTKMCINSNEFKTYVTENPTEAI
jgi:hypothetical protein